MVEGANGYLAALPLAVGTRGVRIMQRKGLCSIRPDKAQSDEPPRIGPALFVKGGSPLSGGLALPPASPTHKALVPGLR